MPDSEVYVQGLQFWPYVKSWNYVLDYVSRNLPKGSSLMDLMCGPGYLLGKIASVRGDLKLKGLDIDERYIRFARESHPGIDFELGDVISWDPAEKYNAVICTGALHHVPYEHQEGVIGRMASGAKPGGFVLISDCYVDDYCDEAGRRLAAAKLGYEYLRETIWKGAPEPVVKVTTEILIDDILMNEFKTSMVRRLPVFNKLFVVVETLKVWPDFDSGYGDYISICWRA